MMDLAGIRFCDRSHRFRPAKSGLKSLARYLDITQSHNIQFSFGDGSRFIRGIKALLNNFAQPAPPIWICDSRWPLSNESLGSDLVLVDHLLAATGLSRYRAWSASSSREAEVISGWRAANPMLVPIPST